MLARTPALLLLLATLAGCSIAARLAVDGTDLTYNGEKVFLIGSSLAYNNYGNDFGNGADSTILETWLQEISEAGGNSVRVFTHADGYNTPAFDDLGYVTACDLTGDFETDILHFLDVAQEKNLLVTLVSWNGWSTNQIGIGLILEDDKLDSYIENCLNNLITTIKGHPALAAFESVTEPEASFLIEASVEPCYDTTMLGSNGGGWMGNNIPIERYLNFIARQNAAVRAIDPDTLITVGAWNQFSVSDAFSNTHNYYKDECLVLASGNDGSVLDFYQLHTLSLEGHWTENAPFTVDAEDYLLDKPLVLGSFSSVCSENNTLGELFTYAYEHGYSGGWSWMYSPDDDCSDTTETQQQYLSVLEGRTDHGTVNITVG